MLAGVLLDRLFGGIVGGDYLIKRPFWVITPFMLLAFCTQFLSMGLPRRTPDPHLSRIAEQAHLLDPRDV